MPSRCRLVELPSAMRTLNSIVYLLHLFLRKLAPSHLQHVPKFFTLLFPLCTLLPTVFVVRALILYFLCLLGGSLHLEGFSLFLEHFLAHLSMFFYGLGFK